MVIGDAAATNAFCKEAKKRKLHSAIHADLRTATQKGLGAMILQKSRPWSMAFTGERPISESSDSNPIEILLVEDDSGDAKLMKRALQEGNWEVRVTLLEDGDQALAYLGQQGQLAMTPAPDLILLDVHLPRLNGSEVLAEIQKDNTLRRIPIVILTSSAHEEPNQFRYDLRATCCVPKPTDYDDFALAVKKIEAFFHAAQLD